MSKNIDKYELEITRLKNELEKYKNAVAELNTLNELAITAGRANDVDQMLNIIVEKTTKTLNAEQGSIMLVSKDQYNPVNTYLIQKEMTTSKEAYHVGAVITGWVLRHEEALIVDDLSKDKRFDYKGEDDEHIHSLLCVPLWFEGRIIGLLTMINKKKEKHFSKNDFTLLSIISVQAGQLIKNLQLQKETFAKQKEAEKLQELDRIKTNFFNNISHEFRSPLTLILGPAEKISSGISDNIVKDANIIKRNSRRLLQLINQLLDLSKLEAGKLKLEAAKGNIVSFVKGVALSFESLSELRDITLELLAEKEFIELHFDRDKMMKILTNIISNAFKFTADEDRITISVKEIENHYVEIIIRDTGIGIAKEEIPKLFDRFYQVDSSHTREYAGTGIGLALTKELVELHHGKIDVESEKTDDEKRIRGWTEFKLRFLLGREHLQDEEIIEEKETETDVILNHDEIGVQNLPLDGSVLINNRDSSLLAPKNNEGVIEDKTIILVVEDNYDMREYIKESLGEDYLVEEAINGEQGIRKAENIIPDLIISDMMMPKMDGNEMTRILKNNEKTSHIPVILLTAKAGQENKIEGLETGADDYITKPFDIEELRVRIKNLINIRKKLQERFSKAEYLLNPQGKKFQSMDEQFMTKVLKVIGEHISEESFKIEELGTEVGMSRTQFYRKLKAITGMPASTYLRTVRLTRAKKMIEKNQGNISEIAYSLGFSSPSYFTKCFRKEFGYPPTQANTLNQ